VSRLGGLRPRLTLLVGTVVVLCLGVAFKAVDQGTSTQLRDRLDAGLRSDTEALRRAVIEGATDPADVQRRARAYVAAQRFRAETQLVFVDPQVRRAVTNQPELLGLTRAGGESRETLRDQRREEAAARALLRSPAGFSVTASPDLGRVRVLVVADHVGGQAVRLGVAQSLQPVRRAEAVVRRAFVLAGALGVLGAAVGGFLVAARTAAPLRRMAMIAGRVDEGDLRPRMAISGRGDEVQALAQSFDQMLDRLEDAFTRQAAFVADASHELRTPLTVIRGQLEVLAMQSAPTAPEVRRVQRLVQTEVDRMNRLVDDLLLLARAGEDGFLRRTDVSLPAFLKELVTGADLHVRRLILEPVPDVIVNIDPDRAAQAVRNLVENALAHTPPAGSVRVRATIPADGLLRIAIDDEGPGIPAAQRNAVFDRFHRLDGARERAPGGAGLGLSIVQAVAEAHGGRAWADEAPDGGARMVIQLPSHGLHRAPKAGSALIDLPGAPQRKPTG